MAQPKGGLRAPQTTANTITMATIAMYVEKTQLFLQFIGVPVNRVHLKTLPEGLHVVSVWRC